MARIQVAIQANGLAAEVRVAPGPKADAAGLGQALAAAGVTHGIDRAAFDRIAVRLGDPSARFTEVIARGTEPIPGEDGYLDGKLLAPPQPGRRSANNNIDYRERDLVRPVANGDHVATVVPPTAGTPGKDVRGRPLPAAPGKPARQRIKDGLQRNGRQVIAVRAGVLAVTDTSIDVVELYTHQGNVDYESGNLHSGGSLLIQGDIDDGFDVSADGDVTVTGTVFGGATAGGSVHVEQGILGRDLTVRAGLDITCHHATSTRLTAGRAIIVRDQAVQSHIAAGDVFAVDGRASVRGGEVRAQRRIEVGSAGAEAGPPTVLATAQLLDERRELARRTAATGRAERRSKAGLHKDHIGKLARRASRAGDAERSELVRIRRRQRELLEQARVRVTGTCYTGVVVRFGQLERRISEDVHNATLRYDAETDAIVITEGT